MVVPPVPRVLLHFVEEEMLRAPLLFDQLIENTRRSAREAMAATDLVQALRTHQTRLAEYFLRSLREQVNAELMQQKPAPQPKRPQPQAWALVDEDEVALDVEMSHTVEAIKSTAEYELRELQTYTSALVGDPDVTRDHNPFRAETFARALWDTAQALPMSRGHQVAFVRHAGPALAQLLRVSYAATTSRLEEQGFEPAAYRTVIVPPGARRSRFAETTVAPDLHRMRETMPAPLDADLSYEGQTASEARSEHWRKVARETTNPAKRQAVALVSRLFDGMAADERVPADVSQLISRLQKRRENLQGDLEKFEKETEYKAMGEILTANFPKLKKGSKEVEVLDYRQDPPRPLRIALEESLEPAGNVQRYFKRYKKAKRGIEMAAERMRETETEIAYLESVLFQMEEAEDPEELENIRRELEEERILPVSTKQKTAREKKEPAIPVRRLRSSDGWDILCGKHNVGNDYLLRKIAQGNDLWFHAQGLPGSHVILRTGGKPPKFESIVEAATAAAYFSGGRGSGRMAVDYTEVKNLRKPKGARPGMVTYFHQKTVFVEPDRKIVESLLVS